jgi:hypothetical protein
MIEYRGLLLVGLCRHWGGLGSTSAMWRIAADGSIEQPNGSILFLYQRIHTLDPLLSFAESISMRRSGHCRSHF